MLKLTAIFVSLSMRGMVMADCPTMYKENTPYPSITHTWCLSPSSELLKTYTPNDTQKAEIVDMHNGFRKASYASNMLKMSWDDDLATIAEHWAQQCNSMHDTYPGRAILATNPMGNVQKLFDVGQSIRYWLGCQTSWSSIVELWYSEIKRFNWGSFEPYDHYTQLVWAESYKVGCSMVECENSKWFAVCNYGPAGNLEDIDHPYEAGSSCECDTCDDGFCVCDKICWAGKKHLKSCSCECNADFKWVNDDCSLNCSAAGSCDRYMLSQGCEFEYTATQCPKECGICPSGE